MHNQTFSPSPRTMRLNPADMERVNALLEQGQSLHASFMTNESVAKSHGRMEKVWQAAKIAFTGLAICGAIAFVANPLPDYRLWFALAGAGAGLLAVKSRSFEKNNSALKIKAADTALKDHQAYQKVCHTLLSIVCPQAYDTCHFTIPDNPPPDDRPVVHQSKLMNKPAASPMA